MKNIIIVFLVILLIGLGVYFFIQNPSTNTSPAQEQATTGAIETKQADKSKTIIGASVEQRDIIAYHYLPADEVGGVGTTTELLLVGGIHGGYEWNTVLVAYQMMDYLKTNPDVIPANLKVTVIPVLNPDGLNKVVGTTSPFTLADVPSSPETAASGRFNANNVDLNRNFDCDWQATGKWQNKTVSGGSEVFSEPESRAIKNYIETNKPAAIIVWYSSAGGVFASNCHNGVSSETNTIMEKFANASGYPAYDSFDFYATTGDLTNWLAKINIPAISVLLTNHTDTEWNKNLAGIKALLSYYGK